VVVVESNFFTAFYVVIGKREREKEKERERQRDRETELMIKIIWGNKKKL
jgi:hypothetical protein